MWTQTAGLDNGTSGYDTDVDTVTPVMTDEVLVEIRNSY